MTQIVKVVSGRTGSGTIDSDISGNVRLNTTLGSDHSCAGELIEGQTAGQDLVFGEIVYKKTADSKWYKADANAESTIEGQIALATEDILTDATGTLLVSGYARDDTWAWTVGASLYVSATAGEMTETAPGTGGQLIRSVGSAHSATSIHFNPSEYYGYAGGTTSVSPNLTESRKCLRPTR